MRALVIPSIPLLLAAGVPAVAQGPVSSAADRRSVAVTVYNDGRGLVREERDVELPDGVTGLRFADVAEKVEAPTVAVRVVDGNPLRVLEQNYEYDLLSPRKLLEKFVGERIRLVRRRTAGDSGAETEVEGRLLAANDGTVWEIDGRIVTDPPWDRLVFPSVPPSLIPRPPLVWQVEAERAGRRRLEVAYLTGGMSWHADYVLSLGDGGGQKAALRGWVTVDNRSGASYEEARLKLVAGDVHRAAPEIRAQILEMAAAAPAAVPQQEALFEYHLYTLPRPTTLGNNQTKQVELLAADAVSVERRYVLRGGMGYQGPWRMPDPRQKVQVYAVFRNDAASGLGQPLPKGVVRVYTRDSEGSAQFVGEDRIDHTAADERVELELGNAFDVVAERRQLDWNRVADRVFESAWEIRLRNHKAEAVRVEVLEPIGGDWTVLDSTVPFEKTTAFEARFLVPVPAGEEAVLRYRVRVTY